MPRSLCVYSRQTGRYLEIGFRPWAAAESREYRDGPEEAFCAILLRLPVILVQRSDVTPSEESLRLA